MATTQAVAPMSGNLVSDQSLTIAGGSLLTAIITAFVLGKMGFKGEIVGTFSSGFGALVPLAALQVQQKRKTQAQKVYEAVHGYCPSSPVVIVVVAALLLVFVEFAVGLITGMVINETLGVVGLYARDFSSFVHIIVLVAVPALLVLAVVVGKQMSYRVPVHPMIWISIAIILARVISALMGLFVADIPRENTVVEIGAAVVFSVVLILLAGAGHRWARRSQGSFVLVRLFRALQPGDRAALLDLAQEQSMQRHAAAETGGSVE